MTLVSNMIENSVYLALDKATMFAELRMQLSSPNNKKKTYIILEGQDDITLLRDCFTNECYLFESYGGKTALEETVNAFQNSNVIGVRDRDYIKFEKPRVFCCDYCNAEMMVVSNDKAFTVLLNKITQSNDNFVELRNQLLNDLIYLSAIRKLNEEYKFELNFKKVSINYLYRSKNLSNLSYLVEYINRYSEQKINDDKRKLIEDEVTKIKENLLLYTNGHDFCELLITFLKQQYPNKNVVKTLSIGNFHLVLYIGYSFIYFYSTDLYKKLYDYQINNNLSIVHRF